ncbi:hypothetical protein [Gemella bergeri]
MKEEILNTINRISSQYPTEMEPDLVDGIKGDDKNDSRAKY